MPPIRHVVSDDIHLISQAGNRCEEHPCHIVLGSAQHVARIIAHIMQGLCYSTLQPKPHGRRTEEIVDKCYAKDTYRDRGHAIGHCCEHLLRRIDIDDRNDSDGVAGQDGGIGPKAVEIARDEDANAHPENECREHPTGSPGKRLAMTMDIVAPMNVAAILLTAFASAAPRVGCARIATVTAADDAPPSCSQNAA
jgi:hypothetical protein